MPRRRPCPGERSPNRRYHDIYLRTDLAAAGFDQQHAAAICGTDPVPVLTHAPLERAAEHRTAPKSLFERTAYRPVASTTCWPT